MSVDDIQKVNKLAQELINQHICSDRQEAVQQAERVLNKNLAKTDQSLEMSDEQVDEFKNFVQRNKEYVDKQLRVFKQDIQSLASQIEELKRQIRQAPPRVIRDNPGNPGSEQKELDVPKPHPRSGNTSSKDVCIEKMFYYGNK